MNLDQTLQFKFDSKMIGKRAGKIAKEKPNKNFDDYIEFQSNDFTLSTEGIFRKIQNKDSESKNIWMKRIYNPDITIQKPNYLPTDLSNEGLLDFYYRFNKEHSQISDISLTEWQKIHKKQEEEQSNLHNQIKPIEIQPNQQLTNIQDRYKSNQINYIENQNNQKNYSTSRQFLPGYKFIRFPVEEAKQGEPERRKRLPTLKYWEGQRPVYRNYTCIGVIERKV